MKKYVNQHKARDNKLQQEGQREPQHALSTMLVDQELLLLNALDHV